MADNQQVKKYKKVDGPDILDIHVSFVDVIVLKLCA